MRTLTCGYWKTPASYRGATIAGCAINLHVARRTRHSIRKPRASSIVRSGRRCAAPTSPAGSLVLIVREEGIEGFDADFAAEALVRLLEETGDGQPVGGYLPGIVLPGETAREWLETSLARRRNSCPLTPGMPTSPATISDT